MAKISVCLLTFNSLRTLERCLLPALQIADEMIVVDSGSSDGTLDFLRSHDVTPYHHAYDTHSNQMNHAISLASHDWVLCLDSDEFLDQRTITNIQQLKSNLDSPQTAYRLSRHWFILGKEVRAIYPVSSPDYPVRLFNRTQVEFNGAPVDDKPKGFQTTEVIEGAVIHDTFFSLHEVFHKLNTYTTRAVKYRRFSPSLLRAFLNPIPAFIKWYLLKGSWRDGKEGLIAGVYAFLYTFLKYFKAWYARHSDSPS